VGGYRVCVPQLETIVRGGAPAVVGIAGEDHWELRVRRRSDRVTPIVNVDDRMRVVVPRGVRHRLGLIDDVVVSVNPGLGVVRIPLSIAGDGTTRQMGSSEPPRILGRFSCTLSVGTVFATTERSGPLV